MADWTAEQKTKSNAKFVELWYSEKVENIDDFIKGANDDAEIDFTAQPFTVNVEDGTSKPHSDDCIKVRNKILSLVVGGTPKQRGMDSYKPRMGTGFAKFESRLNYGAKHKDEDLRGKPQPKKWYARKLKQKHTSNVGTSAFSKSDFDEIIGTDFVPYWGDDS